MTEGARLLSLYLTKHGLSGSDVTKAIGGSRGAVHYWLNGGQRPRPEAREALETWTAGEVPASSWKTPEERSELANVRPFTTGTG